MDNKFFLLLAAAALLFLNGCASQKTPEPVVYPGPSSPCSPVYTYAPSNFIIDVAAGSEVILDPSAQTFPLFCSPEKAKEAISEGMMSGRMPRGDWRVFQLNGGYSELGKAVAPEKYILAKEAMMVDWIR